MESCVDNVLQVLKMRFSNAILSSRAILKLMIPISDFSTTTSRTKLYYIYRLRLPGLFLLVLEKSLHLR